MQNSAAVDQSPVRRNRRPERPKAIKSSSFEASEYMRARFTARIPAEWTFEDTLVPSFWSNIVTRLKRNVVAGEREDRLGACIELIREDHRWYAELYVRGVLQSGLIVQCVGPSVDPKTGKACPIDLETGLPWTGGKKIDSSQFDVRWNVGKRGFDIVRKDDDQVVGDGSNFPTRELALEWIKKTTTA